MSEFNKTELLEKTTEYMNYIAQHKENIRKAWLELRDALKGIDLFQRPKILDEMEFRLLLNNPLFNGMLKMVC